MHTSMKAAALLGIAALTLAACSSGGGGGSSSPSSGGSAISSPTSTEPITLTMHWWGDQEAPGADQVHQTEHRLGSASVGAADDQDLGTHRVVLLSQCG